MSYSGPNPDMEWQGRNQLGPTKLEVLRGGHNLRIRNMDVRTVGGNMYNQHTSIYYIYSGAVPNSSNPAAGKDPSPPNPSVVDRQSPEWGQFVWGILTKFFNSVQGRTDPRPASDPGPSCPGSRNMKELDEFALTSFGDPGDSADKSKLSISKGEAYVMSMLLSGKGLACWQPRPEDPMMDGRGVIPGDVGIFSVQEGFQKIFNIWDDEGAMGQTAAAQGYEAPYRAPTRKDNIIRKEYSQGDTVVQGTTSRTTWASDRHTVTGFEFRHLEPYRMGGVLAITSTAVSEKLPPSVQGALQRHILQHAELLYRHAIALQSLPDNEGLYVVTGCIKSDSWAIAGFSDPMTPPEDTLRLQRRQSSINTDSFAVHRYVWTERGTADGYCGTSEVKGSNDQCLFLKGYKLGFSRSFRERVRASTSREIVGSGSQRLGSCSSKLTCVDDEGIGLHVRIGDSRGANFFGPTGFHLSNFPNDSNIPRSYHPCDAINMALLEKTGLDFALSHDDDWIPFVEACNNSPDREIEGGQDTLLKEEPEEQRTHWRFIPRMYNMAALAAPVSCGWQWQPQRIALVEDHWNRVRLRPEPMRFQSRGEQRLSSRFGMPWSYRHPTDLASKLQLPRSEKASKSNNSPLVNYSPVISLTSGLVSDPRSLPFHGTIQPPSTSQTEALSMVAEERISEPLGPNPPSSTRQRSIRKSVQKTLSKATEFARELPRPNLLEMAQVVDVCGMAVLVDPLRY